MVCNGSIKQLPEGCSGLGAAGARRSTARITILDERGIALLLVLWVITLLTVICAEFSWTMRTETVITRNYKEGEQAYYTAEAGINKAIVELMRNLNQPPAASTEEESEELQEEVLWEPGLEAIRFSFEEHACEVTIEDENNKLSINAFLREAKKNPTRLKALLEEKIGLEGEERDTVADGMIDWWDADHDITGVNGAERDYYLSLDEPYECRDGDLPVIEELLLVKGVTEQIYYGAAGNQEQATTLSPADLEELIKTGGNAPEAAPEAEPEEQAEDLSGEKRNLGLVNIFSTFSSSTSFKININTASLEQLLLLEGMDVGTARAIIRERQVRRFEDPTDRLPEFKHYELWSKDIMVRKGMGAQFYTIKSRGFVGSVTREINCTVLVSKNNFFILRWQEGNA
jgi:type II secretory pathway component PulK